MEALSFLLVSSEMLSGLNIQTPQWLIILVNSDFNVGGQASRRTKTLPTRQEHDQLKRSGLGDMLQS